VTKSGNIVLRSKDFPPLYSLVVTKDSKKIGKISDVFGPSSNPYVSVKPLKKLDKKELSSLKDEVLYELPKKGRGKHFGKKGRIH
jgi:RNA-binding protein